MLGYNTIDEMIIEFDTLSDSLSDTNTNNDFALDEMSNIEISKIYDIFDNVIYDRNKPNNDFYINFLLKRVKKELNRNQNIFPVNVYKSKQRAQYECINYIYFKSQSDELKKIYSICSNIKLYYNNGDLNIEFYHNNGKIEGNYKVYYMGGDIKEQINYVNGKKEGESYLIDFLYDNKQIKYYYIYNNDKIINAIKYICDNNTEIKEYEINFNLNDLIGVFISYKNDIKKESIFKLNKYDESDLKTIMKNGVPFEKKNIILYDTNK